MLVTWILFIFLFSSGLVQSSGFQSRYAVSFASPPSSKVVKLPKQTTFNPTNVDKILSIRAGSTQLPLSVSGFLAKYSSNPTYFFNTWLAGLSSLTLLWKFLDSRQKDDTSSNKSDSNQVESKPSEVKSLQSRFLIVFWLLRMADWLQGPYFYEVYSSKIINGNPLSMEMVSQLFLIGFASTGLFGPFMGQFVDSVGRKAGTLLYTILYALGALSTQSNNLLILILGRLCGGLGTSLLFSAPEAWLVGEFQRQSAVNSKWIGQTFGWAYSGDSLVAITAGQIASLAAGAKGPSGPFTTSVAFLAVAAVLILAKWKENKAITSSSTTDNSESQKKPTKPSINEAWKVMKKDPKILLLGAVQALFEGSMYIFVLQWPPAIKSAIQSMSTQFQQTASLSGIPFGNIFSCFMASCLLGSTFFTTIQKQKKPTTNNSSLTIEKTSLFMLLLSALSMGITTIWGLNHFITLIVSFLLFEMCVGLYFPLIGTLRSKYIPDSHRSVIMNLFGIPLNLIVVSVFLSIKSLGMKGAFTTATTALTIASLAMWKLLQSSQNAFNDNNKPVETEQQVNTN
eukprot:gene8711-9430_t